MPLIHNHYVPAYYLSGFTDPVTGNIFMYFKTTNRVVQTTVRSVANQLRYWSDETEKYLANEVENPANPVLDKIKSLQPITRQDRRLLSRYIIAMLKRVPEGRSRILSRSPTEMRETMDRLKAELEAKRESDPSKADRIDDIIEQIDSLPPGFFDKIPKEVWEEIIPPESTRKSVTVLHNMRWIFLTAPKERSFLASDNPVVHTTATGVRPPAGLLVFPISQNVALWASWNKEWREEGYYPARKEIIDVINYWIVHSATEYVFYSKDKNWVVKLIKKVRKHAKKAMKG